jgi:hypothetical protein
MTAEAGLGWGDIVALVGAAAWLPQIWRFFQKPRVTPIVGGTVEIGFTQFGPIFNPNVAFRAERRDALVTGVSFIVRHERGQETTFRATMLVEIGSQGEYTGGQKFYQQRMQSVVALVLTPTSITERKIQSREAECLREWERLNEPVAATVTRLRDTSVDWVDQVMRSPAFRDMRDFLARRFFWQAGNYTARCEVTVAGQKDPAVANFRFMLTAESAASLTQNAAVAEALVRRALEPPADPEHAPKLEFQWVYPMVVAADS